ncbi:MAG: phenylalanine--tRNA ligase beta subunit-related protein, partial [bacterium]
MLIPLCFFNRYVNVDDKDLIVNSLVNLGIEVENVYKVGYETDNVKIGKIVEKVKHPNADKIWVCKVDLENELLQILTADESVEVDDIVLVALPGCSLPTGLKIDKRNIRGIDSFGMMLSCKELGWDNVKSYGLGVNKFNFDEKISKSIGKYLKDVIKMSDYVIEIKPLANKVETLSVYYLCKEISFVLNTSFNDILKSSEMFDSRVEKMGINLESSDCRYYKAIFLEDVKIDYSPIEMQLILSWMGTKPVNNIVDITNFLMYELAQPLHAFDEDSIYKKIVVRKAKNGEVLHALDGKDYELINDDLVISDEENKVLALAGIIGSRNYSVKENTKKIVIEIAKFLPSTIRRTSKRLGLYTNSSKRFDKNIPDIYVDYAHNRLISLLNEFKVKYRYVGFNYSGFKEDAKILSFSKQKINEYIGIKFQEDDIKNFLNVIG